MLTETQQKCINCRGSNSLEDFQVNNFDGFCHSSKRDKICDKCIDKNSQMTDVGLFLKLDSGLYYHTGWGAYEKVRSQGHLDKIFNKDYYDLIGHLRETTHR